MANILSFDEYFDNGIFVQNKLNEKNNEGGIRGYVNRKKSRKVKKQLAEEIEMSETVIEGIKKGLDELSNDFGELKKSIERDEKNFGGENRKKLESIQKIIEQSKDTTWNINDLIDEGEIDYAGFTGSISVASARYFGVLLFPFTSSVLIHKGYNYFFTLVRNTIRKALVMLQLNFDQFENLIITKSYQSEGWQQDIRDSEVRQEQYDQLLKHLLSGKGKKEIESLTKKFDAVKKKADEEFRNSKLLRQHESNFNCLDQYNNTYTKSLEMLRQYTQEDVQKELDAIKTSMTKLSGQDVDMAAFSELIIAAAEEHAFKVSSSIYNKFAKMTEVFSLPNQAKLLELIKAATDEDSLKSLTTVVDDKKKGVKDIFDESGLDEKIKAGSKVFTEKLGGELGELSDDGIRYEDFKIGSGCTFDNIFNGTGTTDELTDDDINNLLIFLVYHPEICESKDFDKDLNEVIKQICGNLDKYTDILVDMGVSLQDVDESDVSEGDESDEMDGSEETDKSEETDDTGDSDTNEGIILKFDDYFEIKENNNSKEVNQKENKPGDNKPKDDNKKKDEPENKNTKKGKFVDFGKVVTKDNRDDLINLFKSKDSVKRSVCVIKYISNLIDCKELSKHSNDVAELVHKALINTDKKIISISDDLYKVIDKAMDKIKTLKK